MRTVWRGASDLTKSVVLDPAAFWQVFGTYEGDSLVLEEWQVAFLHDHSRFRSVEKGPQIGYSLMTALEALWEAIVFEDATSSFVSVDQREAQEKILYARKAYSGLPEIIQNWIPLIADSTERLEFGDPSAPSRLLSLPATSGMRGRKSNVYLDETDFYKDGGDSAFRAGMGRITQGGRVTMGSTCFGIGTKLDRTMNGEERNFSRAVLPSLDVITNEDSLEVVRIAAEELSPEDFAEEYGCVRGGVSGQSFSPELLRSVQHDDRPIELDEIPDVPGQVLGYDVGTSGHPSVATLLQLGTEWRQAALTEIRKTLPDQHSDLRDLLNRCEGLILAVDAMGIGRHIAEGLKSEFGSRVVWIQAGMPGMRREEMAVEVKRGLESGELKLLADREQTEQFRRTQIESGGKVAQPGSKRKTHFDRFWAVTYAWHVAGSRSAASVYETRDLRAVG